MAMWIRSVASDDGANSALNTILSLFMWSLPVFVIFAAVGGYIITRRDLNRSARSSRLRNRLAEAKT